MRIRHAQHPKTRLNYLIVFGVFTMVAAVVAVPFSLVRSSSLPTSVTSRSSINLGAPTSNLVGSLNASSRTFRSLLPILQPSPETVTIFAADCVTPKTTFKLGETVCAQTDNVTENDRWVNWLSPPDSHVAYGGPT